MAAEARRNDEVIAPMPRKWSPKKRRDLLAIDRYIDGDWDALVEAVSTASNGGAASPLDLSLSRLVSHDCDRLDDLLSGRWSSQNKQDQIERLRKEYYALQSRGGYISDAVEQQMRSLRLRVERLGGSV